MIITLKGATASKNLGGLNFYSILVNKSSGVTVTLDKTTVSKDTAASETVTGTLTVAEGYTLESVKIMMGNTDKTSAWYNASTGAITISGITANVVITANATSNSGSGDSGSGDSGSTEGLSYKLNRNIDSNGLIHPWYGRIAIADFFETNGTAVTATHSGGLTTAVRYYDANKLYVTDDSSSVYCRILLITDQNGNNDITGTPLTSDTVNNTTLTVNGNSYTLTNKIEETEVMYFINRNIGNSGALLAEYNDRIAIDDGFLTNGAELTVTYNGSAVASAQIATRYFKAYTYKASASGSTNARYVLVGTTGLNGATAGTVLTDSNMLDGETITVNGTIYTFI